MSLWDQLNASELIVFNFQVITGVNRVSNTRRPFMKQLFAAFIFMLIVFVALAGAAPNFSGPSPIELVANQIIASAHLR